MNRAVVALLAIVTVGCSGTQSSSSLPESRDLCSGAPAPGNTEEVLAGQWKYAADASPSDLWIGLGRTLTAKEVIQFAEGGRLKTVAFVYPYNEGTFLTSAVEVTGEPDAAELVEQVQRKADLPNLVPIDANVRRARARLAAGDIPFSAIRISGDRAAVAEVVTREPCDVFALLVGTSGQPPPVSLAVNPRG